MWRSQIWSDQHQTLQKLFSKLTSPAKKVGLKLKSKGEMMHPSVSVTQICAKKSDNLEEKWKMEILSIEEHEISLALNDAPKSSSKKVLPARKKLRNELCVFNTSKFIHHPLFSTYHH